LCSGVGPGTVISGTARQTWGSATGVAHHLEPLVHECCAVNCDLPPHAPVGVLERVCNLGHARHVGCSRNQTRSQVENNCAHTSNSLIRRHWFAAGHPVHVLAAAAPCEHRVCRMESTEQHLDRSKALDIPVAERAAGRCQYHPPQTALRQTLPGSQVHTLDCVWCILAQPACT